MAGSFLSPEMVAFTLSLALLGGLLILELIFALLGATLLGAGGEADFDAEVGDIGLDGLDAADGFDISELGVDIDGLDVDLGEYELPELDADGAAADTAVDAPAGPLAWLGLGKAPLVLWMAALFLGFGLSGLILQNIMLSIFGWMLPALIAVPLAAIPGLAFTRRFAGVFARLLPKMETTAVSRTRLARRMGVVTQGTAARGRPAEVKVTDFHGNTHYIRAEPLQDDQQIDRGTEVLIMRHRPTGGFRLIPLNAVT